MITIWIGKKNKLEKQIDNVLIDEEVYWKQRSIIDWLLERDRKTKFFHAKASAQKKKKQDLRMLDENRSQVRRSKGDREKVL